jgi:UDP-N-acetylmuramate: L-alanyl-gamma-D-glutamyl-meso-diaminopimelate ligase
VVVVGTHGKTTTSALTAHLLVTAGLDPSFLVGGVTGNAGSNFRVGKGPHVVVEGDEYDTAYFDKGPKFVHYQPRTAIFTSMELDPRGHLPGRGALRLGLRALRCPGPSRRAHRGERRLGRPRWRCRARDGAGGDLRGRPRTPGGRPGAGADPPPDGVRFTLVDHGRRLGPVHLAVPGLHNVENALGAWAAIGPLGVPSRPFAAGCASFLGVKRRQEVRGEVAASWWWTTSPHHRRRCGRPSTRSGAAGRSGGSGRCSSRGATPAAASSTRRPYAEAFDGAARVSLKTPEKHDQVPDGEELDIPQAGRGPPGAGRRGGRGDGDVPPGSWRGWRAEAR